MLERADEALFEAKHRGRDRIVVRGGSHGADVPEVAPQDRDGEPVPAGRH